MLNEFLLHVLIWVALEDIISSEVSQRQDKCCMRWMFQKHGVPWWFPGAEAGDMGRCCSWVVSVLEDRQVLRVHCDCGFWSYIVYWILTHSGLNEMSLVVLGTWILNPQLVMLFGEVSKACPCCRKCHRGPDLRTGSLAVLPLCSAFAIEALSSRLSDPTAAPAACCQASPPWWNHKLKYVLYSISYLGHGILSRNKKVTNLGVNRVFNTFVVAMLLDGYIN
jgi:hypothetical protein